MQWFNAVVINGTTNSASRHRASHLAFEVRHVCVYIRVCVYTYTLKQGHLRHGHQQLVHTSQRDHKPTTHKWMYYPHTSIEILFEILFKD